MFHFALVILYLYVKVLSSGVSSLELSNGDEIEAASTENPSEAWCPEEKVNGEDYGDFIFPTTIAHTEGVTVKVDCPFGFRDDGLEALYGETVTKERKAAKSGAMRTCLLVVEEGNWHGKWEPSILKINQDNLCREESVVLLEQRIKPELETIRPENFIQLVPMLNRMLYICDHQCLVAFLNAIAYLLTSQTLNGENRIGPSGRQVLIRMVDDYTKLALNSVPSGYKIQAGTDGIIVETARFHSAKFFARSVNPFTIYQLRPYQTTFITVDNTTLDVSIPTEALELSMSQMSGEPTLRITAFSDDVFKSMNENYTSTSSPTGMCDSNSNSLSCNSTSTEDENHKDSYESWGLLTIELDGIIENLTEAVEFVIAKTSRVQNGYKLTCVYWDEDAKWWSTAGVTTIDMDDQVKCSSTHLTAFSALIEPLPLPFPGAEYAPINNSVHSFILSVLSSIGSVCSIIGLSFTVLTYALFRTLRRERSNRILLNLSSSLLLMHIMAISGSKSLWDGHCFVPAASLHYLVLTSFAWMMVEALHMFELLISVFVRPENYFLLKRFVLAWGIPLLVVVICTIIEPEMYSAGRADLCLMNAHKNIIIYYVAYIAPICIMLLVNVIIFCRVFRVLYQQTRRTKGTTGSKGSMAKIQFVKISRSQIKGAVTVLVLLGIGWILGLLAIGPFEVLFRYLYCICNAGQGALIFIFRVALNPHACKHWKKVILGLTPESSLDVSFTTSSSVGGRGNKRKSTIVSPTFISPSNSVENSLTPSNPLSATLATTLASILRSEDERAANCKT